MDAKPKLVRWIVTWSVHWVFYQNNSHASNKEYFKRKLKKVKKRKEKKKKFYNSTGTKIFWIRMVSLHRTCLLCSVSEFG